MFNLNFKDKYKVVHINNELGDFSIGGAGTYMNEIYRYRNGEEGFVYMNLCDPYADYRADGFLEQEDILVLHKDECYKLESIDCEIIVVQFYEFAYCLTDKLIRDKKIVYVVHSVPTPEPPPINDPFGGNDDVRDKFDRLCNVANVIVCVSEAEKRKLSDIYPHYASKIKVVYNGITFGEEIIPNENYKSSRKVFGYIGRADYRKGILECIRELRSIDCELRIACPKNDEAYIKSILEYVEAANMQDRIKLYGWCVGKRKEKFLKSLDALIIPSLYEPFGYVALEAMQYGLPVITSRNGGLDEIFEGYKYKYNPYKRGELKKQIHDFQNDENDEIEEQQRIMLENMKRFSSEKMSKKYKEIWYGI
ncbi:MAG: glycosyltransferase family 4 protein [Lachnospiraceae bacterium]|nr:glycosyltransferase family 4 protein [Lachnospiraceae bacterium]